MKDTSLEIKKEVEPIVAKAQQLVIKDEQTMLESAELLSQCNIAIDKAEAEKETITLPAKAIIKRENARWEPIIAPLKEAVVFLRSEQSRYQTELSRIARLEEEKIVARIAPGRGNLTVTTAIKKMADIEKPIDKVSTLSGSIKFRDHQVLKITDKSIIPTEYFDLNESKVIQALKTGIKVPGTELETVKIPINRR